MTGTHTPRTRGRRRPAVGEAGLNLIEVMIALAILSIGLLGVAAMQITAIDRNGQANRDSEAVHLASRTMEQLIRDPDYDELDGEQYGAYDVSWTTENGPGGGQWYTVRVEWEERWSTRFTELRFLRAPDPS